MQQSMNCYSTACRNFGFTINTKKTEVLHQPALQKTYAEPTIAVEGEILKAVDKFTYLGSTLSRFVNIDDEVDTCIAKASSAFGWNADFTKIHRLQPFHRKHHDAEHDKALPDKMLMTRKETVTFETRNDNYKESSDEFINNIEMHLKSNGGNSLVFRCSSQSDKLIHSKKRQNNLIEEQICSRKRLYSYAADDEDFIGNKSFEVHESTHTRQKTFKCTTSDKAYVEKSRKDKCHLNHIDRVMHDYTKYNKHFTNEGLQVHNSISIGQKSYKCSICQKSFKSKYNMMCHEIIHTGQRPYKCNVCDKSFRRKSYMIIHQTIHTGQRPYTCTTCDKSFRLKSNMISHHSIHTAQKPYKCSLCDKSFRMKGHMIIHENIHTDQGPYKCATCDKGFKSKHSLTLHQCIHTDHRPYKCATCDKGFTSKQNLTMHQNVHTDQKPYKCPMCDKGFTSKHNVQEERHILEKYQ
ncbi:gastrula zinc finger protein XlCGF57.1-like [Protopterus annectens]|uniref:gastrula zinc finger protein XlCGF57.1-like n=1 Tax=Protopterus annectens TaxID=7888 RepID=UPI001CF9B762|nr:gastrula zinc finger protein XlCGF57.1-like [Protopterus annectens]